MRQFKRMLLGTLTVPGVRTALEPLRRGMGTILMLHRLTDPDTGATGDDPKELRRTLAFLRRRGYELVGIDEMFRRMRESEDPGDLGVAFTLDDGYAEQVRVAGPIFAEFDCPATVFLTTGFLDGTLWQWWDQIEYVFESCRGRRIAASLADASMEYRWEDTRGRDAARDDFTARCKRVPDAEKLAGILRLAAAAGVDLPARAPARYAPMPWSEVRPWERKGMSFGPHTVTHPILSRTSDVQSRQEIHGSWERLREMADQPVPIFCYPNGQPEDLGPREWGAIRGSGLVGALTTSIGYARAPEFRARPENPFLVHRFPYPNDHRVAALFASGADRIRRAVGA
jgi:peptidoglycan/xylan/chitin deacetylase (PgdA/CDA1 family)